MRHLILALAALCLSAAPAPSFARDLPTLVVAGGTAASAHPDATAAGWEILRAGGSATDAAMAMMLALTVVEPQSSGIGGGGFLLHHDAGRNVLETIDGRETAPAAAGEARFLGPDGAPLGFREAVPGGLSVGVPGNIALMKKAHDKWGKLSWYRLFVPAIRLAENGYAVSSAQHDWISRLGPLWNDYPEIRALYWRDGKPAPVGTVIRNPELAGLLRELAEGGPEAFYTGDTADAIVAAVAGAPSNPATLTADDLAGYRALLRPPVCMDYRVYRVCGMGPPSSGATTVLGILGMIEQQDMAALYRTEPARAWHVIGEAMRLAYADREAYLGDADYVSVPVAGLIDKDYLARRGAMIALDGARGDYPVGDPPGALARTMAASSEVPSTTHFTAVDGEGNIANMTSTVEGPFGSQLIARGMVLNNELTDFTFAPEKDGRPVANRVAAGKRPLSSMSPTIVYGPDGAPILAIGSAGGKRIIMHVAKTLFGVLDLGLPLKDALAMPNIYYSGDMLLVEENSDLVVLVPQLEALGHEVEARNIPSKLAGAHKTPRGWVGAVDPRSIGTAVTELP